MASLVGNKNKVDVGALLPGTDPAIAELVVNTLQANPTAHPSEILVALIKGAPHPEVAVELAAALMELLLCHEKGHTYWLGMRSHMILTAVRAVSSKDGIMYGPAHWPHVALIAGPPKTATIRVSNNNAIRIWMACESLEGVVVRQSEAIALGNAMIELFGGRILEDRQGPEVLRNAAIEQNFTKRAKMRAQAMGKLDAITLEARPDVRPYHARVACAEAVAGTLAAGDRLVPERTEGNTLPAPVYEVEGRVNESFVMLVAVEEGAGALVGPELWVREDGAKVHPDAPQQYAGFTDEASRVLRNKVPIAMPVVAAVPAEDEEEPSS